MSSTNESSSKVVIWQGFHHRWQYNHRVKRLGSYVRHQRHPDGSLAAVVGHTAASGTARDTASFTEFFTVVDAPGVGFQTGFLETTVFCQRTMPEFFRMRVENLALNPELVGKDNYTVVLNGFDLQAKEHSDKLITFDLEASEPIVYDGGRKIRFDILGSLCFDCRTPECQLFPMRVEVEGEPRDAGAEPETSDLEALTRLADEMDREGLESLAHEVQPPGEVEGALSDTVDWIVGVLSRAGEFLAKAIVSALDVEEVKKATSDKPEAEPTAFRKRALKVGAMRVLFTAMKWRMSTPYILRVHYLIVGGNQDRFLVTDSDTLENHYQWDLQQEITRETLGTKRVQIPYEGTPDYRGTLAFKRICMDATLNEMDKGNPIQWGQGLHLLAWDVAIRDLHQTNGEIAAGLDLFYKNWSEAMSRFRKPLSWGAIRSSGSAEFGARLALLLFRDPASCAQQQISGRIAWKGGARSRAMHPRAVHERVVRFNGKQA